MQTHASQGDECKAMYSHNKLWVRSVGRWSDIPKCSGVSSSSKIQNPKYVNVNMIWYVHLHELKCNIYMLVHDKIYNGITNEVRSVDNSKTYRYVDNIMTECI